MSFLDIKDPKKRDAIVADYLATMNRIQRRNLNEKAQDLAHSEELKEVFHPVIESTKKSAEAITKELAPLQEEMKNLNANLNQQQQAGSSGSTPHHAAAAAAGKKRWTEDMNVNAMYYYLHDYNKDGLDKYFGIQHIGNDVFMMGDRVVDVDNNSNIYIDNISYKATTGLWALIMLATPRKTFYTANDLANYEDLVGRTRVINHPRGTESGITRPKTTYKWRQFFEPLLPSSSSKQKKQRQQRYDDNDDEEYLGRKYGNGPFLPGFENKIEFITC